MLPKKPSELIAQTAEKLDMPRDTVDKVVTFFFQEVRKTLVEMKSPAVNVPNLGRFMIRAYLLPYAAEKCQKYLDRNEPLTFRKAIIVKDMEERIEGIRRLERMYAEEKERKQEVRTKRKDDQVTKGSLEKPEANL